MCKRALPPALSLSLQPLGTLPGTEQDRGMLGMLGRGFGEVSNHQSSRLLSGPSLLFVPQVRDMEWPGPVESVLRGKSRAHLNLPSH